MIMLVRCAPPGICSADIRRVTGLEPAITHDENDPGKTVIIIGTIGKKPDH